MLPTLNLLTKESVSALNSNINALRWKTSRELNHRWLTPYAGIHTDLLYKDTVSQLSYGNETIYIHLENVVPCSHKKAGTVPL